MGGFPWSGGECACGATSGAAVRFDGILSGSLLTELFGEPDENSFGTPDIAEPVHVFVLDDFANQLRAAFAEPHERIVDIVHGEHDAQVTESVHRGDAVVGDHGGR